ncbi:MAG TPA: hypothetical protein VJL34_04915 [Anaerolineales bacterium]|nr:hypothetical protein [Anaerolineales bacterium]
MATILGLLGFFGLVGAAYWLFYRLLWNSAWDKHATSGFSIREKDGYGEGNPANAALGSPGAPQGWRATTIKAMSSSTEAPAKN